MKTIRWAVLLGVLAALSGTAFSHPQEDSPYIQAGPVVQGAPRLAEEWSVISYNGFVFDTWQGEPALPSGLKIEAYPKGTVGYYLVTLRVPITEVVKKELANSGAKIINFMPFNSFLVSMDEAAKARVESSPAVAWVGIFQPAYKVASWMKDVSGTKDVWLQLFKDEDINAVASKVRRMGYPVSIEDREMYKILKVRMDAGSVSQVANLREVMWIEPWPVYRLGNKDAQWVIQTFIPEFRKVWQRGILGEGEIVNTADTGILTSHNMYRDPAVPITAAGNYPTHRKIIAYMVVPGGTFGDPASANYHGTHTAGSLCGDDSYVGGTSQNCGMAPKAKIYFMDLRFGGAIEPPGNLYDSLYTPPYNGNAGGAARISSQSWGETLTGQYTARCSQTDQFMWDHKGFGIYFEAGNDGPVPGTIHAPGTAKNVVTTGATGNGLAAVNLAGFSSRGPCNDTRRKPTVVAPGIGVMAAYGGSSNGVRALSGTSMSTPITAGGGTLVRNYFRKGFYPTGDSVLGNRWPYVSAALVKAVLINSCNNDLRGYTIPDNNIGWGRINLDNTLYFSGDGRKLAVWDDTTGLSTGESRACTVAVNTDAEPLKITMVYTDYYAMAGANPAIVNDLNLVVTSPGGQTYLGNVFSGGWSQTGGTADNRNMEECVYLRQPERGNWIVRIDAPSVPQGTRQPYALAVTGGLGTLGAQVISLRANTVIDTLSGSNGNGNGRVDIGETVAFVDTVYNGGASSVNGVSAIIRCSDTLVMFSRGDTIANLGDIPPGVTVNNGAQRFKLVVRGTPRIVTFTLHLTGTLDLRPYTQDIQFPVKAGLNVGEVIKIITPIYQPDSSEISGLAYDGACLWISDFNAPRIFKVNPNTGDTLPGSIPAPATRMTDLAWDVRNLLWAHSAGSKQVYVLNPITGTIVRQFASRATSYPTGLTHRGDWTGGRRDTLWEVDRDSSLSGPKSYYKCDTLGNPIQSFTGTQIPPGLRVPAGPRCLAYEPQGQPYQPGGTLLHTVTDYSGSNNTFLAGHLYEIRQNVNNLDTVPNINHHLVVPWNVRGVERDTGDWNYWVSEYINASHSNIYKIRGFYTRPWWPGVEAGQEMNHLPQAFALGQGYPNPMDGEATIRYQLPQNVEVSLKVFNITGQLVKTLVSGPEKAGYKQVTWDGRSDQGRKVGAGVYFYRLEAGEYRATRKLVVVR